MPSDDSMGSLEAPHHGISLEHYAELCAEVAEEREPLPALLARHALTPAVWEAVATHWTNTIALDTFSGGSAFAERYEAAFVAAQDRQRPVPAMTVSQWAEFEERMARPDAANVLVERDLTTADYLRLKRHWARLIGKNRGLARQYAEARLAASERAEIAAQR